MTSAEHSPFVFDEPYDDAEDRLSNQVGDYDRAQYFTGTADTIHAVPDWREEEADTYRSSTPSVPFSAQNSRKSRLAIGPRFGEEAGVGYPGGVPPEHQNWPAPTAEQAARNHEHATNWKTIGAEASKRAVQLSEELKIINDDMAATQERHDALEIGHPIRGRETNRITELKRQKANILAKLERLGGAPDSDE